MCQGQRGWREPGASAPGLGLACARRVLARPQSLSILTPCADGVLGAGSLRPKQRPFRRGQEKLPGGKSPPGSGPPRSHRPRALMLAAGATAAGTAASAGARHKGRLCSRSPGCLPRAILLAPGRLPAPAAHTRAFHEGSRDDLLPGGRGRGGRMEPPAPSPSCVLTAAGPRTRARPWVQLGAGKQQISPLLGRVWGRAGPPAPSAPCPPLGTPSLVTLPCRGSHTAARCLRGTRAPCGAAADGSSPGSKGGRRGRAAPMARGAGTGTIPPC